MGCCERPQRSPAKLSGSSSPLLPRGLCAAGMASHVRGAYRPPRFLQMKYVVSFGEKDPAVITRVRSLEWLEFARFLTDTPPETTDKAAFGWYIPAEFDEPRRHSDNFIARY